MVKKKQILLFNIIFLIVFISIITFVSAPLNKEILKEDKLISHNSPNEDIYRTSNGFKNMIYSSAVNILYKEKYIAIEDYINVSEDNNKIKISDLDGNNCYISLNYSLTDSKELAIPKINITKNRGYYYFTTDITKEVKSMSYDLDCKNIKYDDKEQDLILNDNIKIDFTQAEEKQNIKTTYNETTKKLEFTAKEGKIADISKIDPLVSYNFNTNQNIWVYHTDVTDGNTLCTNPPRDSNTSIPTCATWTSATSEDIINLAISDDFRLDQFSNCAELLRIVVNVQENINDITKLNWTYEGNSNNYLNVSLYLWNYTKNSWGTNCSTVITGSTDITRNCIISGNVSDYINSTSKNTTFLAMAGYLGSDGDISTDFVKLEITYDGLIINKPTNNQEVLNNLSTTLNTSQSAYNQTIWYTWNNGIKNNTLCTNSNECQATITFPRQGFYNLTIFGNKSDGTITSKTVNNLFVGNNTLFDYGTYQNIMNITHCSSHTSTPPTDGVIPSCNGILSDYTSDSSIDNDDTSYLTIKDGANAWTLFFINLSSFISNSNSVKNLSVYDIVNFHNDGNAYQYFWNATDLSWENLDAFPLSAFYYDYTNNLNPLNSITNNNVYILLQSTSNFAHFLIDYLSFDMTYYSSNLAPSITNILANNSNFSTSLVNFTFNLSDDNDYISNASIYIDNILNTTNYINYPITANANNSLNFTISGIADGTHSWFIRACDSDNSCVNSSNFTFRVDTNPPTTTPSATSPPAGSSYTFNTWTKNNVKVTMTAFDSGIGFDNTNFPIYCNDSVNSCMPDTWIASGVTISSEGTSYIRYYSNDTLNNKETTNSQIIKIDKTNPNINIVLPLNQTNTSNSQLTINFTNSDSYSGISSCWWTNNLGITNTTLTNCANITGQTWLEGINNITIYVNDSVNNINSSSVTFYLDTINPQISIVTPTNNTNSSNTNLNINYTRSDTNLDSCWYSNDTMAVNTTLSSCTNITTVTWSQGNHNVTIYANDSANNINSSSVSFTIDSINPLIEYGTGTNVNYANLSKDFVYINTTFTEINFKNITFTLKNSTWSNSTTYTTATYLINFTSISNGKYWYYVNITDFVNQVNSTSIYNITLDTNNPNATLLTPSNNSFNNTDQNFTANLTDNLGIKSANLTITNSTGSIVNQTAFTFASDTIQSVVGVVVTLKDDIYTFFWSIVDWAGNTFNTNNNTITIDKTYPKISIVTPSNNTNSTNTNLNINYTVSDTNLDSCWWTGNGSTNQITCGQNITSQTWTEGLNTIIIYANDSANNINSSSVTFRIDTTPPSLSIVFPVDSDTYNINTLSLNYTVSDSGVGLSTCWYRNNTDPTNITINCGTNTTITNIDGTHKVYMWANDTIGNTVSVFNTYTISTTAPAISLIYPSNNSYINTSTSIFNYTAIDVTGVNTCKLYIDGILNQTNNHGGDTNVNSSEGNFTVTNLNNGIHLWNLWCNNTADNGDFYVSNKTFTIDTTNPLISYGNGMNANNTNTTNNFIFVNVSITEINPSNITFLLFNLTGQVNSTTFSMTNQNSNNTINWTNLIDGIYTFNVTITDKANNKNNTNTYLTRIDRTKPNLVLVEPQSSGQYSNNNSISLNFTTSDNLIGIKECWFYVYNASLSSPNTPIAEIIGTTDIPNCQNTTFSLPGGDINYIISLFSRDNLNNFNTTTKTFGIRTVSPAINLYPTNNTQTNNLTNNYFNFTVSTNAGSISNCSLYGDFNGTYSLNQTKTSGIVSNGITKNSFNPLNLTENIFSWNTYCCDNLNNCGWGTNLTFVTDITNPIVNITTTNATSFTGLSKAITYNISDTNINNCFFTIYDANGSVHNYPENTSLDCSLNSRSISVLNYGTYSIKIYGKDKANNENSDTIYFTSNQPSTTNPNTGGIITRDNGLPQSLISTNFSVLTENYGETLDLVLAVGSIRPRTRNLQIINKAKEEVTIKLVCDRNLINDTELNDSIGENLNEDINICDYVFFDKDELTLSANELETTKFRMYVYTPTNASYYEKYLFNVLAIRTINENEEVYSKLSVSARTPIWAEVLKYSPRLLDLIGINKPDVENADKKAYSVFLVSLVISFILFASIFAIFIIKKKKAPLTGFSIGIIIFFISFVALIFVL